MGHLDVNPADLLKVADGYAEHATRMGQVPPRLAEQLERVAATHGPMGFPAAFAIGQGIAAKAPEVAAKGADFVQYSQNFATHSGTYVSEDQAGAGRIQAVDFKQAPPDKPGDDNTEPDPKKSGKKSTGKGSKTKISPTGEPKRQWGTPTDPHIWRDMQKSGTFDNGRGSWEVRGPGRQGGAYASEHDDGVAGHAGLDGWIGQVEGSWERDVFGHPLQLDGHAELGGAHTNIDGALTDHGVSFGAGAEAVVAEVGADAKYSFGPVDVGLGGAGQVGWGGSGGFDIGMQDGKFVFGANAGLAWGLGGKIAPSIAVDPSFVMDKVGQVGEWLDGLF